MTIDKYRSRTISLYINKVYKHHKGNTYLTLGIGKICKDHTDTECTFCNVLHTETGKYINVKKVYDNNSDEILVVYIGLCGDEKGIIYAKSIQSFYVLFNPLDSEVYKYEIDKDTPETIGMRHRLMGLCYSHYGKELKGDPYSGIQCLSCSLYDEFCTFSNIRPLYSKGQHTVMSVHTEVIKECLDKMEKGK